ncbi:hypothetical protein GCM10010106_15610 [Thermopolyspora flexuosa]|uniref:DUF3618 domain-containing protein n=1 Tax=Thermopolyspora flexuosa TaxID=103836 RepID=A0A543IPI9_9ACTN|nr:hypothetical protein [Thermopolyspora flexuosa]TQM72481.1 hypothetical protein FHX40_4622 [Thermopolyspora flexuosa]GGM70306.1 hypothetical protein GCM10010106_15610 [Thermopolyspora flexuosa]
MSLTMKKRRLELVIPKSRIDQVRSQTARAVEKVGPLAAQARDVASRRIEDARVWAAPRLERAAHSVEERIAPRVSAMLSDAAKAVDPGKTAKAKRRWPVLTLVTGVALGAIGYVMYRNNQNWVDSMTEAEGEAAALAGEQVAETSRRAAATGERAAEASERLAEKAERLADPKGGSGRRP